MDVSGDPYAYSRLLARLWREGESFLVVEHDIEVSGRAVRQARHCPCLWGLSPYAGPGPSFEGAALLTVALGCTRFSAKLLAKEPDALDEANAIDDAGSAAPPGHWLRLDARLYSVLRQRGYMPHIHEAVAHHHQYAYGCACGRTHR